MQISVYNYKHHTWLEQRFAELQYVLTGTFASKNYTLRWKDKHDFILDNVVKPKKGRVTKGVTEDQIRRKVINYLKAVNHRVEKLKSWNTEGVTTLFPLGALQETLIEPDKIEPYYHVHLQLMLNNNHTSAKSPVMKTGVRFLISNQLEVLRVVSNIPVGLEAEQKTLIPKEDHEVYRILYENDWQFSQLQPYYSISDTEFSDLKYTLPAIENAWKPVNSFRSNSIKHKAKSLENSVKHVQKTPCLPEKINIYHTLNEGATNSIARQAGKIISNEKHAKVYGNNGGYLIKGQSKTKIKEGTSHILNYLNAINNALLKDKTTKEVLHDKGFFPTPYMLFEKRNRIDVTTGAIIEYLYTINLPVHDADIESATNSKGGVAQSMVKIKQDSEGYIISISSTMPPIIKKEQIPLIDLMSQNETA